MDAQLYLIIMIMDFIKINFVQKFTYWCKIYILLMQNYYIINNICYENIKVLILILIRTLSNQLCLIMVQSYLIV